MCGMLQGSGQGSAEMGEGLYLPWSPQQEFVGVAAASSCSWAGQRISRSGGAPQRFSGGVTGPALACPAPPQTSGPAAQLPAPTMGPA